MLCVPLLERQDGAGAAAVRGAPSVAGVLLLTGRFGARFGAIDLQLAKELAPPEPEPEPTEAAEEAAVDLDAPPVDRQVTVVGAEGLLQADGLLGASTTC